jgi:ATP-dependent protease HslVU (ClpYQ) peptidase subunit
VTTIAAMVDRKTGAIAIAADSAVTGEFRFTLARGKLYQCGDLVVGLAGVLPPRIPQGDYKATYDGLAQLAAEITSSHHEVGHGGTTDDGVKIMPMAGIAVGRAPDRSPFGPFILSATGQFYEPLESYAVVGSGGAIALGAILHALHLAELNPRSKVCKDMDPKSILVAAITVACEHDPGTGGPVMVISL